MLWSWSSQLLGLRRALSLFVLGFCTTLFIMVALAQGGPWARVFWALGAAYGVAFFGLAAEWFWGRWFAMGLGASGITVAILGLLTSGWNPGLLIWGGIHLLVYAPLIGDAMAERYENQRAWRERYGLDEHGVARLKRAVKGAATALPTLIFYTLAPREGTDLRWVLVPLLGLGLFGLLRMRFWGVLLVGLTALGTAAFGALDAQRMTPFLDGQVGLGGLALVALTALLWSVAPFVLPAWRQLRSER
jgi:hypothetical protein